MKAPGKYYREGITLIDLLEMFPNDEAAHRWFIKERWPNGISCPHCHSDNVQEKTKHKTMTMRCRSCRKWFSVRTKSLMECSNIGYQKWAFAIYLMTTSIKGVSAMKLHRDLGIAYKSAWHLAHRIRETWDDSGPFSGPAEADETFVGGKEKNKHKAKAHTNGIESLWAVLKRGFHGVYHHWSPKHLHRYVREFVGRHNNRPKNTLDQMATMARGLCGKRLTYAELTG